MADQSLLNAFTNGIGERLQVFRRWVYADTKEALEWKSRPDPSSSLLPVDSVRMDDPDGMVGQWRANQNSSEAGSSANLPVMIMAIERGTMVPEVDKLRGIADAIQVELPGAAGRLYWLRMIPLSVRAQIVFLASEPHSVSSITGQLVQFFSSMDNRRFSVRVPIGMGHWDNVTMTIFDVDSLMPNYGQVGDQTNLHYGQLDITLCGSLPRVMINPNQPNQAHGPDPDDPLGDGSRPVVTDSRIHENHLPIADVHADPATGQVAEVAL